MVDKRIKFDCPFCGNKKENISVRKIGKEYTYIECTNPKCNVRFVDTSIQRVIDKWNCRV